MPTNKRSRSHSPLNFALRIGTLVGRRLSLRIIYLSCITGLVSGFVAVLFTVGLDFVAYLFQELWAGKEVLRPQGEPSLFQADHLQFSPWIFFLLPILGGLISGWIVYHLAPEAEGHGTDAVIDAFHNQRGKVRKRIPFIKGISSIITLSTGGSAGKEGPIAQIAAGIGSWIAEIFHLSPRERRILLLAGVSGGVGAIFRAPLGGALFAAEVLYAEDFETDAIVPCIFSAVIAYSVLTVFFGTDPIFHIAPVAFQDWKVLFYYLLLGAVCAGFGAIYVRMFYGMRDRVFKKIPIRNHWKPALGGLGVALVGLYLPQTRGGGYGWLQSAITEGIPIFLAFQIAVGKMITTSLTISSGGSGGVFAPSLFIGGMLGAVIGGFAHEISPVLVPTVTPFILVGMASLFAGIANTPISALILVSEMTKGYGLLVPLMLVSVISLTLKRRHTLYEKQLKNRLKSPAHVSDFAIDIFAGLTVKDALPNRKWFKIKQGTSSVELARMIDETHEIFFPVVDDFDKLLGVLDLRMHHEYLLDPSSQGLFIAKDLMSPPVSIELKDSCSRALNRFLTTGYGKIPVVDPEQSNRVVGMLSHEDLTNAYNQELRRRRTAA